MNQQILRYYIFSGGRLPWNISTTEYNNISLFVGTQGLDPQGLFFKPDGSTLYVHSQIDKEINQYSLSIPWDISTATYTNLRKDGIQSGLYGLFFKDDGSKVYTVKAGAKEIIQYSINTPWDISTLNNNGIAVKMVDTENPVGLYIKPDGSKFYIVDNNDKNVYQYSMTLPWDITTLSYDNISYSVATQASSPTYIFFKPDGTKFFLGGNITDKIYQYSLSIPWDISTTNYENKSYSLVQDLNMTDLFFRPDGLMYYTVGTSNDRVYQYNI